MNKKEYMAPRMETMKLETLGFLAASIEIESYSVGNDNPELDENKTVWGD